MLNSVGNEEFLMAFFMHYQKISPKVVVKRIQLNNDGK